MSKQRCEACGRPGGIVHIKDNGTCNVCEPEAKVQKQVEGVFKSSVTAEEAAKPKKKVAKKKTTKKKVSKKK